MRIVIFGTTCSTGTKSRVDSGFVSCSTGTKSRVDSGLNLPYDRTVGLNDQESTIKIKDAKLIPYGGTGTCTVYAACAVYFFEEQFYLLTGTLLLYKEQD
jgi:hypothetical protein